MRSDDATGSLFQVDAPNYSSPSFPPPRQFQVNARDAAEAGVKAGHKNQLIMASTGSGKAYLGLWLIQRALEKGKRAIFVADRTTLINQLSESADRYGLAAHGIMQADHPRTDKSMPFQICSAQTMARREWPDADLIVVDECFTPDVEVLTERGFVRFDQLQQGVKCAQFEDGRIQFVEPTAHICKPYIGPMIRMRSETLCDLSMTPGHQLLIRSATGRWKKPSVAEAKFNHGNWFAAAGALDGDAPATLTAFERLMIAMQADGSIHNRPDPETYSASFSFCKERKIERFLALMTDGNFRFTEVKCSDSAERNNRRRFLVHGLPYISKQISDHFVIANLSAGKAAAIIDEMVEWDGNKHSDSTWYYSSVVEACTDFYQTVALLAGYKTNKTIQRDTRSETFSDVHRLFIRKNTAMIGTQKIKRDSYQYQGNVYCIRVPSGNIVVRRNGKPLVIGNCHTQLRSWTEHVMSCRAKVIGLSATPFSKGLGKIFTNLINATTAHELTQSGVLVPMRVLSCVRPDMEGAATAGGEWTDKAAEERGMTIVGDVVAEWIKHAENRKTIVFGSTILHCEELARQFNECDVNAALFTSHTDEAQRKALLDDFRRKDSRVRVLISVEALAKGFDVPDVGCVCDARPLRKSLSTAIQMWGRGLRASPDTGKTDCLLLDFSGNILRFAKDYAEIFFNGLPELDSGEKLDGTVRKEPEDKAPKGCPQCGAIPYVGRCMSCGHATQSAAVVEAVAGVMREVQIGNTKAKQPAFIIWQQACAYARAHSTPDKQAGRAANIYRDIVGLWPDRATMRFESTPNAPITRDVLNQIKFNNIRFAKSRAA